MRHRIAAACLAAVTLCPPVQAAPELTVRLTTPAYLSGPVGALFPDGARLGAAAELGLGQGWSLALEGTYLRKDWGTAAYGLAITPLLLRREIPLGPGPGAWRPFLSLGAGPTAMTLFGPLAAPRTGLGGAGALGLGLRFGHGYSLRLEGVGGLVHEIRYWGLGLSLGWSGALHGVTPAVLEKPPLPAGVFTRVGSVSHQAGEVVRLALDDLPYRVRPGDTLVVYYQAGTPVKIAKLRITRVLEGGRAAQGRVVARTEAIRRGYLVGTL